MQLPAKGVGFLIKTSARCLLTIGMGMPLGLVHLSLQASERLGNDADPASVPAHSAQPTARTSVERGAYLARLGNCASCHTVRGSAPYAGGRAIPTPFGTVYSSNLTPDKRTGLGGWSAEDFWRAMHEGKSRDGRLLAPAFPYTSFTRISRADSDALYAFLQQQPVAEQANRPSGLHFPFGTQTALWVWRALYFKPGEFEPAPDRSADWNRGAYLVKGLGHCSACHTPRNALGAEKGGAAFAGGMVPEQDWYAPSFTDAKEAGVAMWNTQQVIDLLQTGVNHQATVTGPMADVVAGSTQYLTDSDARAMATYLQTLTLATQAQDSTASKGSSLSAGSDSPVAKLYKTQCASCHGERGEGRAGAFPALAGNRAVLLNNPTNLLRTILQGGYAPSTAGNPRPHGMPPFQQLLDDEQVAALSTFIRGSWGNNAPPVDLIQAHRARERDGR